MIDEFISKSMQIAFYQHKEDTASSYYWQQGSRILPNRLSIKDTDMTNVQRKGRNLINISSGQLLGKFKVAEESPLKQHKPFAVSTKIFKMPCFPLFIGYGTIGISGASGKVEGDTGDLVILYSTDQWANITIFYFAGMGNINDYEQVAKFLTKYVESGLAAEEQKKGNASQQIPSNGL